MLTSAYEQVVAGSLTLLTAGGCTLVLDSRGGVLPAVLYWGAEIGPVSDDVLRDLELASRAPFGDSRIDVPERVSLLPAEAEGWVGTPGISGSRSGADFSPTFRLLADELIDTGPSIASGRRFYAEDRSAQLGLDISIEMMHSGLLRAAATLTNLDDSEPYDLLGLVVALPVPAEATEILDFAGGRTRERIPQRAPFNVGTHLRESRKGKPGLDASYLLSAGRLGFGFATGEVWGVHLGWSGNQVAYAERTFNGHQVLGAGELLLPGEIRLGPGESYRSPWLYASFGNGLTELSGRFHNYLRSRPTHPATNRKVVINTWEAVYFQHDQDGLVALAEAAAFVGAERFVLDDGWFRGRRTDEAGLGDWQVDEEVWPQGLHPLIDKIHGLGMDFGLWVEPEMINLDSDLARRHPEWIFRARGRQGLPSRHQYVLDLAHPDAYRYISDALHNLLNTYPIAYLKWDHNRMVVEAGHHPRGTPGVHAHTRALYRLLEELRAAYPDLEIESCAGGGGRIDLGILQLTDRVWPSDCIDALDRQQILRYTQLLLPPELIGTHLGAAESHTTKRVHKLPFRAASAIWGHMGIEWDLSQATESDLTELKRWVDLHKELRPLLHRGRVVVIDHPDQAVWVNGVIAHDRSEAIFGITTIERSTTWPPGRIRLPGLEPVETYVLKPLPPGDVYPEAVRLPPWWSSGITVTGRVLSEVGVQIPAMYPHYTHLLRATAVEE